MERILGNVETKYFDLGKFKTESSETIDGVEVAYETYGQLNAKGNNAILITHAFSGDAHATGWRDDAKKPGWWGSMIGPGKAFDTDQYFIICSNVLGGCAGTTGPSSLNSATSRPYGSDFSQITIGDMVAVQERLIDHLGIEKLLSVAGGSMGGMQALQWLAAHPDRIHSAIPIATTMKHTPQQIALNHIQRQAIMTDPNWRGGDYYVDQSPNRGLATARMLGHATYTSDAAMQEKFGRRKTDGIFEVESYLDYKGDQFAKRFDANSYIYLTRAMDNFDVSGSFETADDDSAKILVISFSSDWLYPPWQSEETAAELKSLGYDVEHVVIESSAGHDSFLLENEVQARVIRDFLARIALDLASCEKVSSLLN